MVDGPPVRSRPVTPTGVFPRWDPTRLVLVVGTVVIILIIVLTTAVAIRRRNTELTDAARELRTLDLLLAEEAGRSLQSVGLVLDNIADQVAADAIATPEAFDARESSQTVHDILRARAAGVPQLDAITIVSAKGKLVNFSRYWPIPDVDLSDRDYFAYLRDTQTEKPFLSEPVVNRGSGTPTIYLARRISAPDGTFLGMVLGAIELGYYDRFYASLHLERGDVIAMWRNDGLLLARYPFTTTGQRVDPQLILPTAPSWHGVPDVSEKSWALEGGTAVRRVVASQPVTNFPLRVNVGRHTSVILDDWRREVIGVGAAVVFAIFCVCVLMWALLRQFRAYEAVATASLERERAVLARQEVEEALRQSQKMDAVGQLTGGVAHDFNNLLTVVQSSVELLKRPQLTEARRVRYVDAIADATNRAAKLTAQLLAFSRRQTLKPEVFDAAQNVASVASLIERLTGSRVQVDTVLPDRPCPVKADPNQFDTAIVNLAVNGRDAMGSNGRLTISVREADVIPPIRAHPQISGAFVAVSVTDTGKGIAPDVLDRVFEPFFTTKNVGEGTGLGLSQVFGFSKQSGGDVAVESEVGRGTTFTLFLPRAEAAALSPPKRETPTETTAVCETLRVLVVEDNEQVGGAAVRSLTELGFEPTLVLDAEHALTTLDSELDRFDVVFSDVVMPGMSGIELGLVIRDCYPDLGIVLTSGFSHVLAEKGVEDFTVLQKPYSLEDLGRVLKEARRTAHGALTEP